MQTGRDARTPLRLSLVGILLAGALALWLSASGPGHAATAGQTQSLTATVLTTLSWGSAGTCTQNMAAADFGSVTPGVHKVTPGEFTGCVTSSLPFSTTVIGTTPMSAGANTIPFSNVYIYQQASSWFPASSTCTAIESCPLNVSRNVITSAPAATGREFSFSYGTKPATTQAPGTYAGGVVTFTASN